LGKGRLKSKNPTGTVQINAKEILQFLILYRDEQCEPYPASIVADPGCLSPIPHPNIAIPDPGSKYFGS
jgi:hypothetical protein